MESFLDAWNGVLEYCRQNMHEVAFNLWIKKINPVAFSDGKIVLSIRTAFQKDIIEKNYLNLINSALEETIGFCPPIVIIPEESAASPEEVAPSVVVRYTPDKPMKSVEYSFDDFIVGSSNRFAFAACQAVASRPACCGADSGSGYNPLFIYGASGLGKTHLLYAVCNEIRKNFPELNIIYIKGDDFTNQLISAIQNRTTAEFQNKYRNADVLLIDDVQFIAGKIQTQEEFFHTFDTLYRNKKQIVLASDRPPKEIHPLEERLRTRFEWGLLADIQAPDLETRTAIVKTKANILHFDLDDDLCMYIASRLKSNIRQLEGVVKKMRARQLLTGEQPSPIMAQNAIRDVLNDDQPIPVTISKIIDEVCRSFMVTPEEIKSKKRSANISNARQTAMYIVRKITQLSQLSIGEKFGGRDHSTVNYAIKTVEEAIRRDPSYRRTVEDIIKNVREN